MFLIIFAVAWLVCGVLAYGFALAAVTADPQDEPVPAYGYFFLALLASCGPAFLCALWMKHDCRHGLRFRYRAPIK